MEKILSDLSPTMDRLVERWQALEVDSPTVAIFLPVVVLGLTVVYTLISYSRNRPPSRRKSNAVEGGWLGDKISDSMLYSKRTTISNGGTKQLLEPMSKRELFPNGVHMKSSHWCDMGARQYQEDRYVMEKLGVTDKDRQTVSYFGVFDGHGGFKASQYCADRLGLYLKNSPEFPNGDVEAAYKKAYLQIDEDFIDTGKPDGTTVCTCLVFGNERIVCANAGDSRAIVVKRDGTAYPMSKDHKPGDADETKRITDLGGTVVYWGRWRVESVLAVSRAVGDAQLMPYITALPDCTSKTIEEDDMFLVIATDGVWDVCDNEYVANFVMKESCYGFPNPVEPGVEPVADDLLLKWTGRKLVVEAARLGSGDNCSAIVVSLKDMKK
ncbi:hypothetical protein TrVE_jg11295 [Triparma verrucosa]|uniref:PPM-type phosphatase domain-containing protein n=1 Tax=Triparma verrucosa TaxID=1606542 RepID=A0A9W7DLG7_9STRA|nr:hypothetical protein TrVE_jg11295 [Triparma verrucosa]